MAKTIEFLFDVVSPTAYLAYTQMDGVAARAGAQVDFVPVFLGGVMQGAGNQPPGTVENKGKWMRQDLQLWAARYDVPLNHNPFFPVNTVNLQRAALALKGTDQFRLLLDALFKAMWVDEKNLGEAEVAAEVLTTAGLDAGDVFSKTQDPAIKDALKDATVGAVGRGVFGAPTFFVGDQMFFGQDRLEFVEAAARS